MAQMNWEGYGNCDGRYERPMMNVRQTEGERLHEQALSFFTHGNLAQAELLLNKAIALEPSNDSFRETRNSIFHVSHWPSAYGHHPTGHGFRGAQPQRRQFDRSPANAPISPRQPWDSRRLQGNSDISNGNMFQTRSSRGPWPQTANGNAAQYFSNTVADSMFGPNYWAHSDGAQSLRGNSHFGDPRPSQSQHSIKSQFGPACNVSNASHQDDVWGEWIDPGAESNPKPETSWLDYHQSDIPWTNEPRRAASLPNNIRPGSQSSLRGSMANSAERFSMKEHHSRVGRSSPQTWRSEETSSETSYGLDNFEDVSNKVQEWLVRNESSGAQNPSPPDLGKPKKNKRKKKKKTMVPAKQENQKTEPGTVKDFYQGRRDRAYSNEEQSSVGGFKNSGLTKSAGLGSSHQNAHTRSLSHNAPFNNQSSKHRTMPTSAESFTNSYYDKLSKPTLCNNNPNGSNTYKGSYKPFFDPRRIFDPSNPSKGAKPTEFNNPSKVNPAERIEAGSSALNRKPPSSASGGGGDSAKATGDTKRSDWNDWRVTSAGDQKNGGSSSQEIDTDSLVKGSDRSRLSSLGSAESDLSGRMTKDEWEEIINRMYAPLGMPSNISQEKCAKAELTVPEDVTGNLCQQTSAVQNGSENSIGASHSGTFKGSSISHPKTGLGSGTNAGENRTISSKVEYVDVKSTLHAGILENSVPVCHADSSLTFSAPAVEHPRTFLGRDASHTTQTNLKSNPSCQTPLARTTVLSTQKENGSSESGISLPINPVPEPKVEASSAPSVKSSKLTTGGPGVKTEDPQASQETRSHEESERGGAPAKTTSAQPAKSFWEPSRIFSAPRKSQESSKIQLSAGGSCAELNKKSENSESDVSSVQQMTSVKKDRKIQESRKTQVSAGESCAESNKKSENLETNVSFVHQPTNVKKDRKVQENRETQVRAGGSCTESNEKSESNVSSLQQTANLKKDNSRQSVVGEDPIRRCDMSAKCDNEIGSEQTSAGAREAHCIQGASLPDKKSKASSAKASNCLNSSRIIQTNDVPPKPSTSYSYVAWRNQNMERDEDSVKKTVPVSSLPTTQTRSFTSTKKRSNSQSRTAANPAESRPVQDPAVGPTKVSVSESKLEDPKSTSEAATCKIPSRNKSSGSVGSKESQFTTSQKHPQPTSGTASTQPQAQFDSKTVPESGGTQRREESSKSRGNSSSKVPPGKPDGNTRESSRPYPGESKTKTASGTASSNHPFQHKQAETNTSSASRPGRPSTDSNSKVPRSGSAPGSKQQSSAGSTSRAHPMGPSPASRAREDDLGSRPRGQQQSTTSPAGTSPDELDIEDVDPWYKWTRAIGRGLWWALCFAIFLLLILVACLCSTVKVGIKYSWHILKELVKVVQEHRQGGRSHERASGGQGSSSHGNHRTPVQPTRSIDIPTSGGGAIKRILRCNQDNPYEVLGVSSEASEEDIKKYYRRQCMLVHPDKNDLPNAREAFQILQRAYETLTDPVKRREFEMESRHAHFDEQMEDFVKKMEEVLNTLSCDVCDGKHRRFETDRQPHYARYCRRHDTRHPAFEGDVWVETTHLGFKWHYYAMMEDRIFDITEWAACQDMKYMEANACEVRYRVGTSRARSSSRQRAPPPSAHGYSNHHSHQRPQDFNDDMTEELLKEFLRKFQQGESRGGGGGANYGGGDFGGNQERGRKHKKHRKRKR